MNGYARMHTVGIQARADMLEIVAGFQDEARTRAELHFATHAADADDPATLRWLACVIARRLDEIGEDETR